MAVSSSVLSDRDVTVYSEGEEIKNSNLSISNNLRTFDTNLYLSSGETLFAGEKANLTLNYLITGSATITHNGESFSLTSGNSKTVVSQLTSKSGSFSNGVLYGTDKAHIALHIVLGENSSFTITGVSMVPFNEVETYTITDKTNYTAPQVQASYVIKDIKSHTIDLGLNGNSVYMLPSASGMQCLSAIITNSDGDVFIIDGGYQEDYQVIYHYVTELNKTSIKGWFFTHPHQDHFNVFAKFVETYNDIAIENVYYSWSESESWYSTRKCLETGDAKWAEITAFKSAVQSCGCTHIEPTTGNTYNFGSFSFEILYSPKNTTSANGGTVGDYGLDLSNYGFDVNDATKGRYNINDLSLVIMMNAGDKKLLFLGDAGVEAGEWLYDTYKDSNKLEADFVQMAHHGQAGVNQNVYGLIKPKYAFFNCDKAVYNNTNGKLQTLVVRGWIANLGATSYCSQLDSGDNILYIYK